MGQADARIEKFITISGFRGEKGIVSSTGRGVVGLGSDCENLGSAGTGRSRVGRGAALAMGEGGQAFDTMRENINKLTELVCAMPETAGHANSAFMPAWKSTSWASSPWAVF